MSLGLWMDSWDEAGWVADMTTAPTVTTTGVGLLMSGATPTNAIVVGAGVITTTVGVGSTTGTWQHHLRYCPLGPGVTVV